jgi:membrane associated rhomboid family serine protease
VIIPLHHENMQGRRWPVVTIALVALNTFFFLVTMNSLEGDARKLFEAETRTLQLAATYPDTPLTPAQKELVERFRASQPGTWQRLASPNRNPSDLWELQMRASEPEEIEPMAVELGRQIEELRRDSIVARYAFTPSRGTMGTALTANFLHGGWMHLIFNMWFLWLAGAVLEDTWGRALYGTVYLACGMAAVWSHYLVHPDSSIPLIGASGAVSALMGGFLVRFPQSKIQLAAVYWALGPRMYRFTWPAYVVLSLWLLGQLFYASLSGEAGGVAYWAHIGGFVAGAGVAIMLRFSGIEKKMDQSIEAKVSWSADPHLVKAGELIEKNELDQAIAELQAQIAEKPDSAEAYELKATVLWKKGDVPGYLAATEETCRVHVKMRDFEAAWQDYEDYIRAGGQKMPAATWMDLCRHAEDQQQWGRAAEEYERLASAWPTERASVLALISAARIHLSRLENRSEAIRLYAAAEKSPVPHRDWEETIRKGLQKATASGSTKPELVGSGPKRPL